MNWRKFPFLPPTPGWTACGGRPSALAASSPARLLDQSFDSSGASDALAAMRGMTEFFLDLHDNPQAVEKAAGRVNQALMKAIDIHYSMVQPKLGGYGHIFGHWAPGKTFMLQEDALGMCSPSVYREIFMPLNAAIVRHLGPSCVFPFPLHRPPTLHARDEYSRHRRGGDVHGDDWANLAGLGAGVPGRFWRRLA